MDSVRWLVSEASRPFLEQAAAGRSTLQLATALRKSLTAKQAHLVIEQAALRERARLKFALASEMFFMPRGLEQATDEMVARYKAARFPAVAPVADLCCGIGGDLLALAARGEATGFDRDPTSAIFAEANLRAAGLIDRATVEAVEVCEAHIASCAAWHIDPDRRPEGRRTTRVELYEPGPELIDRLLACQPNAAIKLAPAAELPEHWAAAAEQEWISRGRECRQLVAWFGDLAQHAGRRSATIVGADATSIRTVVGNSVEPSPEVAPLGRFIFEPDPAVLASGLAGVVAREHGLQGVTPGVAYLSGDAPTGDPALTCFEIEEVLPYDPKRVRALLRSRGIGRLEVKKRGVNLDPAAVRRALQMPGEAMGTLIIAPIAGQVTAILAQRRT